jgi:hypothetical protein
MCNIVCTSIQETNPTHFSLQVKNKPLEPMGAMCLFLSTVLSRTNITYVLMTGFAVN